MFLELTCIIFFEWLQLSALNFPFVQISFKMKKIKIYIVGWGVGMIKEQKKAGQKKYKWKFLLLEKF